MEQQKLLWIIFALAAGFLVIVAAAFVLFVPPAETPFAGPEAAALDSESFDVTDYLKNGDAPLALEEETGGESDGETSFVIGVTEEKTPEAAVTTDEEPAPEKDPAAVVEKQPEPAKVTPPAPVKRTPPAPPKKVKVTEYWIQAGSFTHRDSAEIARENLQQKEFTSIITTKTIDGTNYFRVRIGPYRYKAEAEKFLDYVKNIDSFEASQIYEVYVERTL